MLKRVPPEKFDAIYRILEDSFPADERRPYAPQRALFLRREYKVLGLYSEQNDLKALFALYEFDDMIFLEHFAVASEYRNQGLGSVMLRELMNSTEKPICLEVEPPKTGLAVRRIAFYERNGFCFNDYFYTQPPLAEGQNPVELKLMSSGRPLTEPEFQNVKGLLYARVYHCAP